MKKALDRVGGIYLPPTQATPPMFAGKSVALFDIVLTMDGLKPFDDEMAGAVEIRVGRLRVMLLPLERIIVSKRAPTGRKTG